MKIPMNSRTVVSVDCVGKNVQKKHIPNWGRQMKADLDVSWRGYWIKVTEVNKKGEEFYTITKRKA
jgi:hypothetical protein